MSQDIKPTIVMRASGDGHSKDVSGVIICSECDKPCQSVSEFCEHFELVHGNSAKEDANPVEPTTDIEIEIDMSEYRPEATSSAPGKLSATGIKHKMSYVDPDDTPRRGFAGRGRKVPMPSAKCQKPLKKFKKNLNTPQHLLAKYYCGECKIFFRSSLQHIVHMRHHIGEFPYGCPHCKHNDAMKSGLQAHIKCRHKGCDPNGVDVRCPWCPEKFASMRHFRNHKIATHMEKAGPDFPGWQRWAQTEFDSK